MNLMFATIILYSTVLVKSEQLIAQDDLPPVVYNPWFSYMMLRWLLLSNPQLLQQLLEFYPPNIISYNGLAETEYINTLKSTSIHVYHQVQNIQNSQVFGFNKHEFRV
ncbi:uncharacterized protein [Rhodnius prolixus]|uniref:uncharacterized protein n=1 Tax=Rhodnius prolixus TaxID=13249 RepID=UPI003D188EC3